MHTHAIIVAAGSGQRMGTGINKIFLLLNGEPIIARTARVFQDNKLVDNIVIVVREKDAPEIADIISRNKFSKVKKVVIGGKTRQDSVYNGLLSLSEVRDDDIVLIHNAANPLVDDDTIEKCIIAAKKFGACVAGFRAKDTIKRTNDNFEVAETIPRDNLWQAQTPQAFLYKIIMWAHKKAQDEKFAGTDDAVLAERIGHKIKMIECFSTNIKITSPEDLILAEKIMADSLVGFGMDSHRFVAEGEKPLVLGGVIICCGGGFKANSDGDVILHALFNAISQALGESSIGNYADHLCKEGEKNSAKYLEIIMQKMKRRNYCICNIGIMCEGKEPNISRHEQKIKESLAKLCKISKTKIGITATPGEDLTPFGRGEGMQCFCIVKLDKR